MAAQIRKRSGLTDPRVAAVLGQAPRHVFVPGVDLSGAYADQAIVTRYRDGWPASPASQPAMVAAMLEQLRGPKGGSVLEIGVGTGYNAALLPFPSLLLHHLFLLSHPLHTSELTFYQALAHVVHAKTVWRAFCAEFDVPQRLR